MELDIDIEMKDFCFNKIDNNINNDKVKQKPQEDLLLSIEETSSVSFQDIKNIMEHSNSFFDKNKNPKFDYKRILVEKDSNSIISSSERRLIKDIEELKNNKNVGKVCEIIIKDYKRINDTYNFEMIIEFKNYFSLKFVFYPDYPFSPPKICFHSGQKYTNVFDSDGNILLENAKKSKWTPILWLSTLVISIELLISKIELNNNKQNSFNSIKMKYQKRKWNDYLNEEKKNVKKDLSIFDELTKTLKKIKPLFV
jgi:ubiquitin-protein ligase